MKKVLSALLVVFLLLTPGTTCAERTYVVPPTMDLSAIRYIICDTVDGQEYSGSGFLIGKGVMATAFHVAEGNWMDMPKVAPVCYDVATNTRIVAYKLDPNHDFALMTGPGLPTDIPYIKYACNRPIPGKAYTAYGITDYGQQEPILRSNTVIATDKISSIVDVDSWVEGIPSPGMRVYQNPDAPGMSGGPVADGGSVIAINDAGDDKTSQNYDLADTILCQPNGAPART